MKHYVRMIPVLALSLIGGVLSPVVKADGWNKKTTITINQPIDIQNTNLPAGSYVIKLSRIRPRSVTLFKSSTQRRSALSLRFSPFQSIGIEQPATATSLSITSRMVNRRHCTPGSILVTVLDSNLHPLKKKWVRRPGGGTRTPQWSMRVVTNDRSSLDTGLPSDRSPLDHQGSSGLFCVP